MLLHCIALLSLSVLATKTHIAVIFKKHVFCEIFDPHRPGIRGHVEKYWNSPLRVMLGLMKECTLSSAINIKVILK